jgi:hypothetical protein
MVDLELTPPAAIELELSPLNEVVTAELASKAPIGHTHSIESVSGLAAALLAKDVLIDATMTAHLEDEDPHSQYVSESALAAHALGTGPGGHLPGDGLSNDDIAPDAAINWGKISKVGAVPADVGAAASSHSHTEFLYEGTTPPASPAVGKRWRDTSDLMHWYWNGTYWLTEQVFSFYTIINTLSSGYSPGGFPVATGYNVWLESFDFAYSIVAGTVDATNKWTVNVVRETASASVAESTIETTYGSGGTKESIRNLIGVHRDISALSLKYFRMNVVKTGVPPNLTHTGMHLRYRLVKL